MSKASVSDVSNAFDIESIRRFGVSRASCCRYMGPMTKPAHRSDVSQASRYIGENISIPRSVVSSASRYTDVSQASRYNGDAMRKCVGVGRKNINVIQDKRLGTERMCVCVMVEHTTNFCLPLSDRHDESLPPHVGRSDSELIGSTDRVVARARRVGGGRFDIGHAEQRAPVARGSRSRF